LTEHSGSETIRKKIKMFVIFPGIWMKRPFILSRYISCLI
jgi:hypothetical protein